MEYYSKKGLQHDLKKIVYHTIELIEILEHDFEMEKSKRTKAKHLQNIDEIIECEVNSMITVARLYLLYNQTK